MDASGFITAGGKSTRMGRDKSWLELGGIPMVELVLRALRTATRDVNIIANDPSYSRFAVPVIGDTYPGIGPLEAIRTALDRSQLLYIVLVGCDMPFVTGALFEHLLSQADGVEAVVPLGPGGQPEPLCAVYSKRALSAVTRLILDGERKVSRLFDHVATRLMPFADFQLLAGSDLFFENINSPEDYRRALARLGPAVDPEKCEKT